jgi:flavodoxin I
MKTLIVYDSAYGNTEKIAKIMGSTIGGDTAVVRAGDADLSGHEPIDFLIVGSPTYAGRPTQPVQDFLDKIPGTSLKDVSVASFDTRVPAKFAKIFGYASIKIDKILKAKGGVSTLPPEGFLVKGKEGPLIDGEEERASAWAREVISSKM